MRPKACATTRSQRVWTLAVKWSLFGASAFSVTASQGWKSTLDRVAPGLFPPDLVVQVKALACELPAMYGRPLSRWSTSDLVQQVQHVTGRNTRQLATRLCEVGSRRAGTDREAPPEPSMPNP